jgi:hypothetical protein
MAEIRFWVLVSLAILSYGASLTISELLFHPLKKVFTKGPLTPLIRSFAWSPIPLHSKFSIMGYIFSYYAIACSWSLTVVNFFIAGFNLPLDLYCKSRLQDAS